MPYLFKALNNNLEVKLRAWYSSVSGIRKSERYEYLLKLMGIFIEINRKIMRKEEKQQQINLGPISL